MKGTNLISDLDAMSNQHKRGFKPIKNGSVTQAINNKFYLVFCRMDQKDNP